MHFVTSRTDRADKFTQQGEFVSSTVLASGCKSFLCFRQVDASTNNGQHMCKTQYVNLKIQQLWKQYLTEVELTTLPHMSSQALADCDRASSVGGSDTCADRPAQIAQCVASSGLSTNRLQTHQSTRVLKVKYEGGKPKKYKARFTVMGYHQRQGIDYSETFSPVANLAVFRIIIAVGVTENFVFHQPGVSNAFPNTDLDEEVYMKLPSELNLLTWLPVRYFVF